MIHPRNLLIVFCLAGGFLLRCTLLPTSTAGGGVETGNSTVVGRVMATAGVPGNAEISIVSDQWADDTAKLFASLKNVNIDGYYFIDSLRTGSYRITGHEIGGSGAFTKTVFVSGKRDTIFVGIDTLRHSSQIVGRVTVYDGRNPAGITVGLRGTKSEQTIGADGRFMFNNVAPGEQILVAGSPTLNSAIPQLMTISVPPDTVLEVSFFVPQEKSKTLDILPGQTWGYWGDAGDLLSYFSAYAYRADTVIDGRFTLIIDGKHFVKDYFSSGIGIYHNNMYIIFSDDTVMVLEKGNGPLNGLLKSANAAPVQNRIPYDTARFNDLIIPLIFSSQPNQTWYYRQPGDPRGSFTLIRKYAGNEVVKVPGGTFNCLRMEWEWDSTGGAGSTPVKAIDYISTLGCVKKVFNYVYYDSSGGIDSLSKGEEISYCGPDTAQYNQYFPPLSPTVFDSITASIKAHWNPGRFIAWMKGMDSAGAGNLLVDNIYDDQNIYYKAFCLFANCTDRNIFYDSSTGYFARFDLLELINRVGGFQGIESLTDFKDNLEYLMLMLISPKIGNAFAQGWDDCDWDWRAQGALNTSDTTAPCGKSATMQSLSKLMAGKYYYLTTPIPWVW